MLKACTCIYANPYLTLSIVQMKAFTMSHNFKNNENIYSVVLVLPFRNNFGGQNSICETIDSLSGSMFSMHHWRFFQHNDRHMYGVYLLGV